MNMNPYMETINLVKSLNGRYKQADKKMVVELIAAYKKEHNCSYKYAYEVMVEGNPSFSTYTSWRRKMASKSE